MELLAAKSAAEFASIRASGSTFAGLAVEQYLPSDDEDYIVAEDGSNIVLSYEEDAKLLGLVDS